MSGRERWGVGQCPATATTSDNDGEGAGTTRCKLAGRGWRHEPIFVGRGWTQGAAGAEKTGKNCWQNGQWSDGGQTKRARRSGVFSLRVELGRVQANAGLGYSAGRWPITADPPTTATGTRAAVCAPRQHGNDPKAAQSRRPWGGLCPWSGLFPLEADYGSGRRRQRLMGAVARALNGLSRLRGAALAARRTFGSPFTARVLGLAPRRFSLCSSVSSSTPPADQQNRRPPFRPQPLFSPRNLLPNCPSICRTAPRPALHP